MSSAMVHHQAPAMSTEEMIAHYQRSIEKSQSDPKRLLHCISKLYRMKVTVQHLQATGIGRTINALRKDEGEVGVAAKSLVAKWKAMVAAEESSECSEESSQNDQEEEDDDDDDDDDDEDDDDNGGDNAIEQQQMNIIANTPPPSPTDASHSYNNHRNNNHHHSHMNSNSNNNDNNNHQSSKRRSSDNDHGRSSSSSHQKHAMGSSSNNNHSHSSSSRSHKSERHSDEAGGSGHRHEKSSHSEHHSSHSSSKSDRKKSRPEQHNYHGNLDSQIAMMAESSADCGQNDDEREQKREKAHGSSHSSSHKHHSSSSSSKHKEHKEERSSSSKATDKSHHGHSSSSKGSSGHKSSSRHGESSSSSKNEKSHRHEHKASSSSTSSSSKHKSRDKDASHRDSESSSKKRRVDSSEEESHATKRHKSDKPSTSSSSYTSSPKKKSSKTVRKTDNDFEIDQSMGASFAEALGMIAPSTSKSSKTSKASTSSSSSTFVAPSTSSPQKATSSKSASRSSRKPSVEASTSTPALLTSKAKLPPLEDISVHLASPAITNNYKPLPMNPVVMDCVYPQDKQPQRIMTDEEMFQSIATKNVRTKVYSGAKSGVLAQVPSLHELCIRILQKNIDALEYTGGVPFEILRPVMDRATPEQLFTLEHYNPYLMEDSDVLWQQHCNRKFRSYKRREMETWREMYIRCTEEQEHRLSILTENIKSSQTAAVPVKQTILAYVDAMVKPPRNIQKKQAQYGTDRKLVATPAARVSSLSNVQANIAKVGDARLRALASVRDTVQQAAANPIALKGPKKAPLMAKTLQLMKGRFKR